MAHERARGGDGSRSPTSGQWSAEVSRALREALEGYCTPDMGAMIVQTALSRVGLVAPPETPAELSEFVTGALSPEVERRLGDDAATDLEQRMAVMIHVLSRASRPQAPAPALDDEFGPEPVSETRPLPAEAVPSRAASPSPSPAGSPRLASTTPQRSPGVTSDRPTQPPEPPDDEPFLEIAAAAPTRPPALELDDEPLLEISAPAPSDRPTKPPVLELDDEPLLEISAAAPSDRPTRPPEPTAPVEALPGRAAAPSDRPTHPPEPGADALAFERPTSPRVALPPPEARAERATVPPHEAPGVVTFSSDSVRNLSVGVVSPDSRLAGRVRAVLGDGGQAFGYRTLPDLARAEAGSLDAVLVDRRGSAPSATLVLPDAIRGAQIVLWPAKPEAAIALSKTATHVASVTSYGADVGVEDLIVLLRLSMARR